MTPTVTHKCLPIPFSKKWNPVPLHLRRLVLLTFNNFGDYFQGIVICVISEIKAQKTLCLSSFLRLPCLLWEKPASTLWGHRSSGWTSLHNKIKDPGNRPMPALLEGVVWPTRSQVTVVPVNIWTAIFRKTPRLGEPVVLLPDSWISCCIENWKRWRQREEGRSNQIKKIAHTMMGILTTVLQPKQGKPRKLRNGSSVPQYENGCHAKLSASGSPPS